MSCVVVRSGAVTMIRSDALKCCCSSLASDSSPPCALIPKTANGIASTFARRN